MKKLKPFLIPTIVIFLIIVIAITMKMNFITLEDLIVCLFLAVVWIPIYFLVKCVVYLSSLIFPKIKRISETEENYKKRLGI